MYGELRKAGTGCVAKVKSAPQDCAEQGRLSAHFVKTQLCGARISRRYCDRLVPAAGVAGPVATNLSAVIETVPTNVGTEALNGTRTRVPASGASVTSTALDLTRCCMAVPATRWPEIGTTWTAQTIAGP